jgi:hypothetical protein
MKRSGCRYGRAAVTALLLATLLGVALTSTASAAETVANQPARLNSLVLDRLPHGKAALATLVWEGSSFTLQQGWRGALAVANARLATGDFSGDGLADGAVLTPLAKKGARLSLFTAAPGSGSFSLTVAWKSARSPFSARLARLACGDVTGDGRDDLVVLAPKGKRGVQLLLFGGAAASWTAPTMLWSAARSPFVVSSAQLACGDLDGDSKSDVIILGRSGSSWTLRGLRSDGTRAAPQWTAAAPAGAARLAAGDVTGDGKADAVILSATGKSTSSVTVLSATDSGFSSAPYGAAPVKASAAQLAVSDLTGDGRADGVLLTAGAGGRVLTAPAADQGYAFVSSWRASGSQSLSAPRLACAPMVPTLLGADTKVLSTASAAALVAVSESGTLTFDGVTPQVAALAAGDILIAGACNAAPEGLLAKVTSVQTGGGSTTAATTPVPMEEAVESLDVAYEGEVSVSDLGRPSYLRPGVRLISPGERGGLNTLSMTWSINCDLDGIKAGGSIGLSQHFALDFKIARWKLRSARFTETTTQTSSLTLTASKAWEKSKKYVLASYPLPIINIQAGTVPVTVFPSLEVYVGASGKLEVGITTSLNQEASLTTGVAYDSRGFHPIAEPSASATFTPPTLYGSASLKGYAAAKLATRLYSLAGPYAAVEGYGELTADTRANPWWRLHAGLDAKLGFDVKVLKWSVADWSLEKNILDWQVAAADGAFPGTPSTDTIAFVRGGDIWTMNPDGSGQRNLTSTYGEDEWCPSWSPTANRIAFLRRPAGQYSNSARLWTMKADGTDQKSITLDFSGQKPWLAGDLTSMKWAPDGSAFAIENRVPDGSLHSRVILADAETHSVTELYDPGWGTASVGAWRPDSRELIVEFRPASSTPDDAVFIDVRSRAVVAPLPFWLPEDSSSKRYVVTWAVWSPDGAQMAYVLSLEDYSLLGRDVPSYLVTMPVVGGSHAVLDSSDSLDRWIMGAVTWSRDARFVAYVVEHNSDDWQSSYELRIIDSRTGAVVAEIADAYSPAWSR